MLALPAALAACRSAVNYFQGYAFIANQEGGALAAVDLEVMAVAKHIPVEGAPTEVLAPRTRAAVYALTPDTGSIHEIDTGTLKFARKTTVAARAVTMAPSVDEKLLYAATADPPGIVAISLDDFRIVWRLRLPEEPTGFALASDGRTAAAGSATMVSCCTKSWPRRRCKPETCSSWRYVA